LGKDGSSTTEGITIVREGVRLGEGHGAPLEGIAIVWNIILGEGERCRALRMEVQSGNGLGIKLLSLDGRIIVNL